MSGNYQLKLRTVGAQAPLGYGTGLNMFANRAHAVTNVCHREYLPVEPLRQVTAFGQKVEYDFNKDHDYHYKTQMILVTNAATFSVPQVNEQFVEGAGYRMIENIQLLYNSNRLNCSIIPWEWQKLQDMIYEDDRLQKLKEDNYLLNKTVAQLRAALANGYTFTIDLYWGTPYSRGLFFMTSSMSARPRMSIQLATQDQIIQDRTSNGANISNLGTLIRSIQFNHNCIHVLPSAREEEMARYNTIDGVFSLVDHFDVLDTYVPAGTTGTYPIQLNTLTGTYDQIWIICRARVQMDVPWHTDPTFWTGKQFTYDDGTGAGTDTFNWPDRFDLQFGTNHFTFNTQTWEYNTRQYRRIWFPFSQGGDATMCILFTEDPLAKNALLGSLDFNVSGSKVLTFYWDNGTQSSPDVPTGIMHVRVIAHGPEYLQKNKGAAGLVFG